MPAYIIGQINITNPDKYQEYAKLAGHTRIVVSEFPDVETAKRFYNSVEYQAAREKRLGAADFNMMVVEGA
jgi:uncharacterized protein (DUF1330 family)